MNRNSRLAKLALVLAVLALLAAACRGDDAADDTGDDTATDDSADVATDEATDAATTDEATDAPATEEDGATDAATDAATGEIATDVGVTQEPCPAAVNPDNGCIYLGQITDQTGIFSGLGTSITSALEVFWEVVNEEGGLGGYDVDASTYIRDNNYNVEQHAQEYEGIKNDVLALQQSLGSPTTFAIQDDLEANNIVTAPVSWTSAWLFSPIVVEAGNSYCIESMNGLSFLDSESPIENVTAIHYPGDYGDDGAAGAARWAEDKGIEFTDVPTVPGPDNQAEAIQAALADGVDVVLLTVGPTDSGAIVGQAAAQGFDGRFLFQNPSWNPGLLESAAADAMLNLVTVAGPVQPYETDTPGHQAMREAVEAKLDIPPNDGLTVAYTWGYNLKAILEQAIANGDLTRAGMAEAVSQVTSVDYQGMLPDGSGNLGGEGGASAVRATSIARPSTDAPSGLLGLGYETGDFAANFEFDGPCYENGV